MAAVTPRSAEIVRVFSPVEIYSEGSSLFTRKYSIRDYKVFGAAKYFLVNVSANHKSILLEKWKFMKITMELSDKTGLLPVIIGDMTSEELKQYDTNGFNLEYLNKHNMKELILLCRYAEFVISLDTERIILACQFLMGRK
ncbi:MAG: hypothetical protein IJU48_00720 [Synergistaceae bacterium]|nr:hypothetical protein [Synergistaceae bacterium]